MPEQSMRLIMIRLRDIHALPAIQFNSLLAAAVLTLSAWTATAPETLPQGAIR
jgi:hypothetical protein